MFNPFPGLRPFEPEEDHLFFGREQEIDELLRRLRAARLLAIIGSSGSGKSSLVRSGLIPSLRGGFMVGASPDWRVAIMRPGVAPIAQLAAALERHDVLSAPEDMQATNRVLLEATLLRGGRGLIEAVRQARLPPGENLLVFVDQFEELFRFRRDPALSGSHDDAAAFVKLLLEAAADTEFPIYVVMTMRADFIGDCMAIPGLPEAVNAGQFLVPRMTREELRSAITGPVAVGGGRIAGRLVLRLLNEFGDGYDKLPILQHALMRSWTHWETNGGQGEIDIEDYEAVGTTLHALSLHADEAFEETGPDENKRLTEKIFKALTDTFTDPRGTRRPTSVADLALICEASPDEIVAIIDIFRQPSRSFLMPPLDVSLEPECIVDISHESLMWCWSRLALWAEEERTSADVFARLSAAAQWYASGRAGLWRNPELEFANKWRANNQPNAAWARRYNLLFPDAMAFLDASEGEWKRASAEAKKARRRKLAQARLLAAVFGLLGMMGVLLAVYSWRQRQRAEANFQMATRAVDESLSAAGREQGREGSDLPQLEEFRKQLLDKAETFYTVMARENTSASQLGMEQALAHSRLGDIDRLLGRYTEAAAEYGESIDRLSRLLQPHPQDVSIRRALGYSYNWLGETLRNAMAASSLATTGADAERDYTQAITLQSALARELPSTPIYRQELARSFYNRGILHSAQNNLVASKEDFDQAIALLHPLVIDTGASPGQPSLNQEAQDTPDPRQDLARVENNEAILLSQLAQPAAARTLYDNAIALGEQLVASNPGNREYKAELANFCSNEARLLADGTDPHADPQQAKSRAGQALSLLQELAAPTHSLQLRVAEAAQLQAQLLSATNPARALSLTDDALAAMQSIMPDTGEEQQLFSAIYMNVGANYLELARQDFEHGKATESRDTLGHLDAVFPHLTPADKDLLLGHTPH